MPVAAEVAEDMAVLLEDCGAEEEPPVGATELDEPVIAELADCEEESTPPPLPIEAAEAAADEDPNAPEGVKPTEDVAVEEEDAVAAIVPADAPPEDSNGSTAGRFAAASVK